MFGVVYAWSDLRPICGTLLFAAIGLGFGTTFAIGEDQQISKSTTKPAPGDLSAWVKVCAKNEHDKQICLVKYEALDPKTGGVLVAVAMRSTEGEEKQELLVNVPTAYSLMMPAGVRIKIDNDEPISLQYTVCLPTNCQVQTELTKQVLERLRKGNLMLVAAINTQQNPITFRVPLNGFGKTADGVPVDTAKYQETRRRMMEFAKKAAEGQKKSQWGSGQEKNPPQAVGPAVTTVPVKRPPGQSPQ
jgi:invasion protein IalB